MVKHRAEGRKVQTEAGHKFKLGRDILDLVLIFITAFLIVCISYITMVRPFEPELFINKYIEFLKNKEYDKALDCYINIPENVKDRPQDLISALREKYDNISDIRLIKVKKSGGSDASSAELQVFERDNLYKDSIMLYNIEGNPFVAKKDWRISFPFKTQDITITGTEDSRIFIDDLQVGQIKNGKLTARGILSCTHQLKAIMDNVGESAPLTVKVNESTGKIDLKVKPSDNFKSAMEKLVSDFCKGWSEYCLKGDPSSIKPYLTDRLNDEYTKDTEMFNGSKYVLSEGSVQFRDFEMDEGGNVILTADEKWHMKEVATSWDVIFKDNNRSELEQIQYISWEYHILKDSGTWKIDSTTQLDFKQEILNK